MVASGLSQPVGFVQNPAIANVQLILQKEGLIRTLQGGTLLAAPFLDLTAKVEAASEQGVLGLAFAPDYATSGRLYVCYSKRVPATPGVGQLIVARFKRHVTDPLRADASTEFDLVWPGGNAFITQPFGNHKGGNIAFGPDNMLYVGLGDGGSGSDPFHHAQNPATLLGKMLRIDVSVLESDAQGYDVPADNPFVGRPGVLTEIWSFGWRNPWRWSFDVGPLGTGAMVVGDVGQGQFEEIDYEPAGRGGRNYGWRNREGAHNHVTTLPAFSTPLTDPLWEYGRSSGQSVIGGFVYRGLALGPGHLGRYFFADFSAGRVWSLGLTVNPLSGEATAGTLADHTSELGTGASQIASFGIDAQRELYVVNFSGTVRRIVLVTPLPSPPAGGCTTPDPFGAMGGGTCHNGGWLPPGIAPPSGTPSTPAPTTPTPPTPTPPSTPAPSSGTCTTPNPFLAMGGGTCYNGGWLPPGMTPPSGAPSTPAPTPPSTSHTAEHAGAVERHVHDAESVSRDGRRHLLQRRLAAARHDAAERRPGGAGTHAAKHTGAAEYAGAAERHVHDAEPISRDGRRHLLQRRLAAARHDTARWRRLVLANATGAHDAVADDTDANSWLSGIE